VYYSAAFYLKPRSPEEYNHLIHYVKLRRLELLASYGDYLGQKLQESRADLKAAAASACSEVEEAAYELGPPKPWVNIADELAGADMDDLRKHVYIACGVLGIDPNHMLWLIKEWADRNRTFLNQIRQYISDCHWPALAEQVCRDLKELLNVTDPDTAANNEKALLSIQNEYFNVIDRDDPQYWFPNERAVKLTEEKMARRKKRAQEQSEPTDIRSQLLAKSGWEWRGRREEGGGRRKGKGKGKGKGEYRVGDFVAIFHCFCQISLSFARSLAV